MNNYTTVLCLFIATFTSAAFGQNPSMLSDAELIEHIHFAASSLRANEEKLEEWEGVYTFRGKVLVNSIPIDTQTTIAGPFYRQFNGRLAFSIDHLGDQMHCDYKENGPSEFTSIDGRKVNLEKAMKEHCVSTIITPEHSLSLIQNVEFGRVFGKDLPESVATGRNINRESSTTLERKQTYSEVVDPRHFFLEPDDIPLTELLKFLKRELEDPNSDIHDPDTKGHVRGYFQPLDRKERLVIEFDAGNEPLTTTMSFDPGNGYCLREYAITRSSSLLRSYAMEYTMEDNVQIPTLFDSKFYKESGELFLGRKFELETSEINGELQNFDLRLLGATPGDRYVDHLEKQVWIVNHDFSLIAPEEFRQAAGIPLDNSWRATIVIANVLGIIVIVIGLLLVKKRRLGNQPHDKK